MRVERLLGRVEWFLWMGKQQGRAKSDPACLTAKGLPPALHADGLRLSLARNVGSSQKAIGGR